MKNYLRLLARVLFVAAGAGILLLLLNGFYELDHANRYHELDKFKDIEGYDQQVLVSNLGSSHGEYDFVYDKLREQGLTCFNFALSSQTYEYDEAILKQYVSHLAPGGILFIPVSYFSFNDEVVTDLEVQERSVRYYQFLEPSLIPNYDAFVDLTTHKLPVLTGGYKLLKVVPDLIKEHTTIQANAAEVPVADPETVARFTDIGAQRYERHFVGKENYFEEERIAQLEQIIDIAKEAGVTPILITTPFTSYYTDQISSDFMNEFYTVLMGICERKQVSYYDYGLDERFRSNLSYFGDPDHLNTEGGLYFMSVLATEVPDFTMLLNSHGLATTAAPAATTAATATTATTGATTTTDATATTAAADTMEE